MELTVFQPHELPLVLRALRQVALANEILTPAEAELIEGIALLHGCSVVASELQPVEYEQVASVVTDPHRRKRAVQLAIIMTLVEGDPDDRGVAAVKSLATALAVPERGLSVLSKVAHGHLLLARIDVVRRMRGFLERSGAPGMFEVAAKTLLGLNENAQVAQRYLALGDLPAGSLGRAVFDHYRAHGFALPGEPHGTPEAMMFHDVGHVLSGYGVDPQGEIQQAAFQAGFVRTDGFLFLLFGILQFHVGVKITPVADAERGYFDVPKVLRAFQRGSACALDVSDHFDLFTYAHEPLDALRERWGVAPLS
jgi:hypothetical protein